MKANLNHGYKWIHDIIKKSQVEISLINIDQAKEILERILLANVKFLR